MSEPATIVPTPERIRRERRDLALPWRYNMDGMPRSNHNKIVDAKDRVIATNVHPVDADRILEAVNGRLFTT